MTAGGTSRIGASGRSRSGTRARTAASRLEIDGVAKHFSLRDGDQLTALEEVSLTIEPGDFVCFVGPSGCGKSTLLNMIAGLLRPSSGSIRYAGEEIDGPNHHAGYLTQGDTLLPWRTTEDNVALGLEIARVPRAERRERVAEMLRIVGLAEFGRHYPAQLSGGMRKRALLARTLIYGPSLLLLDEPFGALDAQLRLQLQNELLALWEREPTTVVFVTHDLEEALFLADRIVTFAARPGRIVHVHHNELPRPRSFLDLKSSPEFGQAWRMLWETMGAQA